MISLLLNPSRGTFDDHYISQYPILDGKQNILYILHFHLNHPGNQHILPLLLEKSIEINPFPAGQRLLKLLCISLSDMSIYTEKKKIGGGAYGTVYECNTNLADPQTVAIKETKFPSGISERCTLYDIFTEITCLEHFRLEPSITDIYDYGVTENSYIIVMKKYPCSLRDWRQK
jgi:serine/threonine protein kinase